MSSTAHEKKQHTTERWVEVYIIYKSSKGPTSAILPVRFASQQCVADFFLLSFFLSLFIRLSWINRKMLCTCWFMFSFFLAASLWAFTHSHRSQRWILGDRSTHIERRAIKAHFASTFSTEFFLFSLGILLHLIPFGMSHLSSARVCVRVAMYMCVKPRIRRNCRFSFGHLISSAWNHP